MATSLSPGILTLVARPFSLTFFELPYQDSMPPNYC